MSNNSLDKKYASVQLVAFEINTMPHGFETQGDSSDDYYIGLADAKEDIKRRVALVEDVLAKAISIRTVDSEALKVFMMPEFFFRGKNGMSSFAAGFLSPGLTVLSFVVSFSIGAYTLAESTDQEVVNSLIDLVTDEKWADWLFVFGTAVAFKEPNLDNKPHDQGINFHDLKSLRSSTYGIPS